VSRAEHFTTTRRQILSRVVPSAIGLGLAAVLVGCGSGQITQTDTQQSAVNGASGNVGSISVRDAQLAFPGNQQGTYAPGSTARLIVTIVNGGLTDDTLTKITSPAVTSITIDGSATGTKLIPGTFSIASGQDPDDTQAGSSAQPLPTTAPPSSSVAPPSSSSVSPSSSPAPGAPGSSSPAPTSAAPQLPGKVTIDLVGMKSINGQSLGAGLTIPITFYFAHAGTLTLAQVPIGAPADNSGNS
jgi:hypothetical protein